ncbi:hypothetical protein [Jiulongibacter sp. NS-SX5]|uniref:hypothetical protein n=1 Tax=Jiulongibacter sp. NS-SX5 TaxID=3463854 RepID=UPI0040593ED1
MKHNSKARCFWPFFFVIILYVNTLSAATYVYNGSGDWDILGNWNVYTGSGSTIPATVLPGSGDDVIIQSPSVVTLTSVENVRSITLNSGATLNFDNGKLRGVSMANLDGTVASLKGSPDQISFDFNGQTYNGSDIDALSGTGVQSGSDLSFPVVLKELKLMNFSDRIEIFWKVEEMSFFSHFEVLKSIDAQSFEVISRVEPSDSNIYSFSDFEPNNLYRYYRLKMVDLDGSYELSRILSSNSESRVLNVYPNPMKDNLLYLDDVYDVSELSIFDIKGIPVNFSAIQKGAVTEIRIDEKTFGILLLKSGNGTTHRVFK